MADNPGQRRNQPRRGGSFQRIEPLDETSTGTPAAEASVSGNPGAPSSGGESAVSSDSAPMSVRPAPLHPLGARFTSASSALVFAGQLAAVGRSEQAEFRTGDGYTWWVLVRIELDLGRE